MSKVSMSEAFSVVADVVVERARNILREENERIEILEGIFGGITASLPVTPNEGQLVSTVNKLQRVQRILTSAMEELTTLMGGGD